MKLPKRFESVDPLEDIMATPSAALVADLECVPGDLLMLGVGGKMGPTRAPMAKRAMPEGRIIGVARFSGPGCGRRSRQPECARSNATCSIAPQSRACPRRRTPCSWLAASLARPGPSTSPGR